MNKSTMLDVAEIGGTCKSRSTSAGSSKHSSSIGTDCKPEIQQITYPSPFVVGSTFLGYGEQVASLSVDFPSREIQSCPASGIGPPPGLEQFGSFVESEAEESEFVPVKPSSLTGLPEIEYPPPFVLRNTLLGTTNPEHIASEAIFMTECQAKSRPAIAMGLPPGLSGVSHGDFGSFTSEWSQDADTAAFTPHPVLAYEPPPQPPAAPYVVPPRRVAPAMDAPMCPPQLGMSEVLPDPMLGTFDMPTVGSAWHRLGTCKPCAFLHTKGCGNGVECEFCHLCAPGEKKRRKKARQAVARMGANMASHSMSPPAAIALAESWAFPHAATDATSMYRY